MLISLPFLLLLIELGPQGSILTRIVPKTILKDSVKYERPGLESSMYMQGGQFQLNV